MKLNVCESEFSWIGIQHCALQLLPGSRRPNVFGNTIGTFDGSNPSAFVFSIRSVSGLIAIGSSVTTCLLFWVLRGFSFNRPDPVASATFFDSSSIVFRTERTSSLGFPADKSITKISLNRSLVIIASVTTSPSLFVLHCSNNSRHCSGFSGHTSRRSTSGMSTVLHGVNEIFLSFTALLSVFRGTRIERSR